MFSKILVANRGEIACRVIATARGMGIRTVAVYSDADAKARHTVMADEAVRIGGPTVADSYLQGDRIIAAAHATGAEAIHPGYGFLSENPDFVAAVEAAGLVFIGPSAAAIRAMGLKDAAKTLMERAGVPVVPGWHGAARDPETLAARAAEIGYPVLIKARAGGGGKGMRLVKAPTDFAAALASAEREAQAAFGDPVCLIEKYILCPRHIEIQVFGDAHGNVIHLFERDCSLQRRHQKVIEEAPAPGMTPEMRQAMGHAAVEAARAIGYCGAGTVEFIVDGSGPLRPDRFWFMEMNTRLQVEHPVSEAITGLDFVELQLRVAAGEPLPVGQEDLAIDGWAFEARIYAEDADRGFLPATGTLDHLRFPPATEFAQGPLRIDSGVRQGDVISPYYDPMIAKLIAHGPTRAIALSRLAAGLRQTRVIGSVTNLPFLAAVARHAGFARGEVDTGLIGRDLAQLLQRDPPGGWVPAAAALAATGFLRPQHSADPWQALAGWRHWQPDALLVTLNDGNGDIARRVTPLGAGAFLIETGETALYLTLIERGEDSVTLALDGRRVRLDVLDLGHQITVCDDGRCDTYTRPDPDHADLDTGAGDGVVAPMPGFVTQIAAVPGQRVARGDLLVVLEAMKMEHALCALRDGIVAEVRVMPGDQVQNGMVLVQLEPNDG